MKLVFWGFFLFAGLSGFGAYMGGDKIAGVFMICSAALACPFMTKFYINEARKKDRKLTEGRLLAYSVAALVVGFIFYPSYEENKLLIPEEYMIDVTYKLEDVSPKNVYNRILVNISADGKLSRNERIAAAMKAALETYNRDAPDYVHVTLWDERSKNLNVMASVLFAPDDCKPRDCSDFMWQIRYADEQISDRELDMLNLWYSSTHLFQKNGMTDEDKMIEFISNSLEIKKEEVRLPSYLSTNEFKIYSGI